MTLEVVTAPASWEALLARLAAAALAGAALGVNREIQQKPAGLRTHAMVALGAALFALLPLAVAGPGEIPGGDPVARVLQGIVTGVGFIGGGVILHRSATKEVYGLTTATSIWLAAAMGASMGLGLWRAALIGLGIGLLVLVVGAPVDSLLRRFRGRADSTDSSPGAPDA